MIAFNGMTIRPGVWSIESVMINSETVLNDEGFVCLQTSETQICIEPAGFRFDVSVSTARSAILESRGKSFFADFTLCDDQLHLELRRPQTKEKVVIEAQFIGTTPILESLEQPHSESFDIATLLSNSNDTPSPR